MACFARDELWQLLMADDFAWRAGGPRASLNLVTLVFFYVLVGMPFSWGKCAGGFQLSWVGYFLDAQTFAVGLSDSRAAWLLRWAREAVSQGGVLVRDFVATLGRFGPTWRVGGLGAHRWYRCHGRRSCRLP